MNNETRISNIGVDAGGQYEYWEIKDFDICLGCKHFSDNKMENRFECDVAICEQEMKYHL